MNKLWLVEGLLAAGLFSGCRTTYLLSGIASGEVGGGTRLQHRYHVDSCEVVRADDLGWFWDNRLRAVSFDQADEGVTAQLVGMYPGVFSTSPDAVGVQVSIRVIGTDASGDSAKCQVEVRGTKSGKSLGSETLFLESRDMYKSDVQNLHDMQSCRPIHVDQAYRKTVIEGFGGALAAALEKSENGGIRLRADMRPPVCVQPVTPMEKPL